MEVTIYYAKINLRTQIKKLEIIPNIEARLPYFCLTCGLFTSL